MSVEVLMQPWLKHQENFWSCRRPWRQAEGEGLGGSWQSQGRAWGSGPAVLQDVTIKESPWWGLRPEEMGRSFEEEEEDPIRMELLECHTQEGNLPAFLGDSILFPHRVGGEMVSQWDFMERRDALEHLFPLSHAAAPQITAPGSWEGQRFTPWVTTSGPLPHGSTSVSPHRVGEKE